MEQIIFIIYSFYVISGLMLHVVTNPHLVFKTTASQKFPYDGSRRDFPGGYSPYIRKKFQQAERFGMFGMLLGYFT